MHPSLATTHTVASVKVSPRGGGHRVGQCLVVARKYNDKQVDLASNSDSSPVGSSVMARTTQKARKSTGGKATRVPAVLLKMGVQEQETPDGPDAYTVSQDTGNQVSHIERSCSNWMTLISNTRHGVTCASMGACCTPVIDAPAWFAPTICRSRRGVISVTRLSCVSHATLRTSMGRLRTT
jgi:hypothetical protein